MSTLPIGLLWKLRRVAAGLRQQDVGREVGISACKLSAIERGDELPTDLDRELIEKVLPPLPALSAFEEPATQPRQFARSARERASA